MQNFSKLVGGIGVVGVAAAVLILSLRAPSTNRLREIRSHEGQPLAKLFGNQLIPGHPMYPLHMGLERLRLMTTQDPAERFQLLVQYGVERQDSAQQLFTRKEVALGLNTAAKAQGYLIEASIPALQNWRQQHSSRQIESLDVVIGRFFMNVATWKEGLSDQEKSRLDEQLRPLHTVQERLNAELDY